jgi:hypothetical protein
MPKAWERPGSARRTNRELRTRVLVVCEGTKTEPLYFRGFPLADVIDYKVVGSGSNTLSVVQDAIGHRDQAIRAERPFNEVWCVFDRDSFKAERFNRACQLARDSRVRIAVTHEAFELWYLLHFHFNDAAISRATYADRLSDQLGFRYRKNNPDMYAHLLSRQPDAIRNAKTLLTRYRPWNPEAHNPSTNVHQLVERLNELAE